MALEYTLKILGSSKHGGMPAPPTGSDVTVTWCKQRWRRGQWPPPPPRPN